jgi:hypothetical protein
MLLFEMLLQEGDVIERFLKFARVAIDFYEAFILFKFLKLAFGFFSAMEDIPEVCIREYVSFV